MKLIKESFVLDETSPTFLRWQTRPVSHFQNDRRFRQANARCAGKPAGCLSFLSDGSRHVGTINLGNAYYSLSRIVFALANGYDPGSKDVDHIDGDRSNNNPSNLRAVTHAQNCINRNSGKANASGVTGVYWLDKSSRWIAHIAVNGKRVYLGCYADKEDAVTARREGEEKYHGEYQRVS